MVNKITLQNTCKIRITGNMNKTAVVVGLNTPFQSGFQSQYNQGNFTANSGQNLLLIYH